jgi:hypothetical protein
MRPLPHQRINIPRREHGEIGESFRGGESMVAMARPPICGSLCSKLGQSVAGNHQLDSILAFSAESF